MHPALKLLAATVLLASALTAGAIRTPAVAQPAAGPTPQQPMSAPNEGGNLAATPGPVDFLVLTRAHEWVDRFQRGAIDRSQLTPAFNETLTPSIAAAIQSGVAPLGPLQDLTFAGRDRVNGITTYTFAATFKQGTIAFIFSLDDRTQKIDGMHFIASAAYGTRQ